MKKLKNKPFHRLLRLIIAVQCFGLLSSCLSEIETPEEIHQKELKKIEEYLDDHSIDRVSEYRDEKSSIIIFWESISESGINPEKGDSIKVDYTGSLLDETVFDTSNEEVAKEEGIYNSNRNYAPLHLKFLGDGQNDRLVSGFEFALSKMEKGDVAKVFIPSIWGYGSRDLGVIPPHSVLIFDVHLLEVKINEEDTNE
ncbi:FKBP-type peptidyl-prolyl cis-trans isomerase [Echinicola jeungdonensis]|uniref:Peptidyl-prolyl cis-trans isomerase n=1 Tax=Echinicola jeungdonensis TaxID=709343 RepID=A0ABV5J3C5_9BACT|nr:FKBP-type peptidyl-prolyl cis-trans isomerase [Echinicola jeungdonensis]MDN3668906.1 FKBP-type peptidyl-prolyl cis-trans isomerase [Echinicola jeungdonensis]